MPLIRDRQVWALFLAVWVIYLFHVGPMPGVNENRYIDLTRSIVEDGRLAIDRFHYNTVDKSYYNGHYYAGAAPGPSLLAIPPYIILYTVSQFLPVSIFSQYDKAHYIRVQMAGKAAPDAFVSSYPLSEFIVAHMALTGLICSLLAALTVVLLYYMLGEFGVQKPHRLVAVAIYAFGTITFFYATRFYAHVPSTFFVFLSYTLLHAIHHGRLTANRSWAAGLALGLAALMEYTVAPLVMVLGVASLFILQIRHIIRFAVGAFIPVCVLMVYHWLCFDNPLTTAYSFPMSLEDPGPHTNLLNAGYHGFGLPSIASIWGLTFSPYRGLFLYSPALILAIVILIRNLLDRSPSFRLDWIIIGSAFLWQFLFNAAMLEFWSGGYVFGPRYLTPVIPFLIIPLGCAFGHFPARLMLAVGGLGILINWAGVQYIVSQNVYGALAIFLLSGPTTQLFEFISSYLKAYTTWEISISPVGGFLMLGVILAILWKWAAFPSDASPTGEAG